MILPFFVFQVTCEYRSSSHGTFAFKAVNFERCVKGFRKRALAKWCSFWETQPWKRRRTWWARGLERDILRTRHLLLSYLNEMERERERDKRGCEKEENT